eukprot:GEMP01082274.1.p1 GENE.GEMP01082274.1~~GEMP01082274.1.p1  ORF type:complete len:107 (+),score=1.16 GEMP01082274.1:75-395(+)
MDFKLRTTKPYPSSFVNIKSATNLWKTCEKPEINQPPTCNEPATNLPWYVNREGTLFEIARMKIPYLPFDRVPSPLPPVNHEANIYIYDMVSFSCCPPPDIYLCKG